MNSIRQVVDKKILRIVDVLLKNPAQIYHLQKISIDAKVPLGTTHRLVKKLSDAEFFEVVHVGKSRLYRLNKTKEKEFEVLQK